MFPEFWLGILEYDMGPEMCPFCGQQIEAGTEKCFFCDKALNRDAVEERLEELEIEDEKESRRWHPHHSALLLILVFTLIFVAVCPHPIADRSSQKKIIISNNLAGPLKAEVSFTGTEFTITNNDSFDWSEVELQILTDSVGNVFSLKITSIPAGQSYIASATAFTNLNSVPFDSNNNEAKKIRITSKNTTGKYCSFTQDL